MPYFTLNHWLRQGWNFALQGECKVVERAAEMCRWPNLCVTPIGALIYTVYEPTLDGGILILGLENKEVKHGMYNCQVGNYKEGKANLPLWKDDKVLLITNIPALVCKNCEDFIINPEVSSVLYKAAKEIFAKNAQNTTVSYERLGKIAA